MLRSTGKTVLDKLVWACMSLAFISSTAMMLLVTFDAAMGKLASRPVPGTIEITSYYLMVAIVFLTLPYIEARNTHISADVITSRFSERVQLTFSVVARILTMIFYCLLAYTAWHTAISSTAIHEQAMANFTFYIWPSRWVVFFGLVTAILCALFMLRSKHVDKVEGAPAE